MKKAEEEFRKKPPLLFEPNAVSLGIKRFFAEFPCLVPREDVVKELRTAAGIGVLELESKAS